MPAVREYKTAAQINAERAQRQKAEVRRQREVEQAYAAHTPTQVRFCADMMAAGTPFVDYPKGTLRQIVENPLIYGAHAA